MRLIAVLAITAALGACSPAGSDDPPISPESFARIYGDMMVLASRDSLPGLADSPTGAAADSLLVKAGVTREEYLATVEWLNRDVARWRDLLAMVVGYLEHRTSTADSALSGGPGRGAEPPPR